MMKKITNPPLPPAENKKHFTGQTRRAHVKAYQASGDTMLAYSEKHDLGLSTLKRWVSNYGEKKVPGTFIPAVISTKKEAQESKQRPSMQRLEIITGDIKVILPEIVDIAIVVKLIKELSNADTTQSAVVMGL